MCLCHFKHVLAIHEHTDSVSTKHGHPLDKET